MILDCKYCNTHADDVGWKPYMKGRCSSCWRKKTKLYRDEIRRNPKLLLNVRRSCRKYAAKRRAAGGLKKYIRRKQNRKLKAHWTVQNALISGVLQKQTCFCGKKAQAHHEDYSKPLDVIWLCQKHHSERHVQIREEELRKQIC